MIREVSLGLLSYTINSTRRIRKIRLPAKTIDKSNLFIDLDAHKALTKDHICQIQLSKGQSRVKVG